MADVQRCVIVDSPEIAGRGEVLFPGAVTLYANGVLPADALTYKDAVIASTDRLRIDAFSRAFLAAHCPLVREWEIDLSGITTREALLEAVERVPLKAYEPTDPPPQAKAPTAAPPGTVPEPAGGGPDADTPPNEPEGYYSDGNGVALPDIPHDADDATRSVRTAAALKRAAFEREPDSTEWPEPADFWNVTALPEFLPEYLPAPIAGYVTDQASRAGVDPAQVALNCYVACAALIRAGIDLQMQEDSGEDGRTWREKPILWGAVVGDPSSGKGPALDIALHKFYKIASVLRAKDEAAWERYDEESKIHERRMQSYIAEAAKSPLAVKPEAPQKPPRERLWTDDVTKEVVAKLLTENPRGKIAIIKDELAGWFGSFDAYGNGKSDKDRPDWLSFYESKERYIDRAMEGRSYHVKSWGGIILGGIQPEVLARISGKLGADGMLQRFQIIVAGPKRQVPKRAADPDAVRAWNRIQENLAGMQSTGRSVTLSAEAAAFMDDKVQWIANAMQSGLPPALVAALGKWEGLFGRLMLTSHCIECAALGAHTPSPTVSLKTAEQAWGWMRWVLWPHAVYFYMGTIDQGEEFRSGKAFAEYVLARDILRIKPHTLTAGWSHYRNNFKTIQQRREFWARVEQAGWVRPLGVLDRNTQLAHEYEINPLAFDGRFVEQAKSAGLSVLRYRDAMHPAMLAQQGREPGED